MSKIIDFYSNVGTDNKGRKLDFILNQSDDWFESTHDFIQWLFPLKDPSNFNPEAPLLTDYDIKTFKHHPVLNANILESTIRMFKFLEIGEANPHWISKNNHNFLRVTSMLLCLHLLGLNDVSKILFNFLKELYHDHPDEIGPITMKCWQIALNGNSV